MSAIFSQHSFLWLRAALLLHLMCLAAFCQGQPQVQTNRLNRPVRPSIRPTAAPPPQVVQAEPMDPLLALMMQQANTDTNVIADAEFDPPAICVGEVSTYRVVVTALSEAVVLPEKLPFPPGLTVKEGGKGMSYASTGQALQYRTTFNFHITPATAGNYTMPPFGATGNGRQVLVPARQLTVLPAGSRPPVSRPALTARLVQAECFIGQSVPVQAVLADSNTNNNGGLILPQVKGESIIVDQSVNRQWREARITNGVTTIVISHEMAVIPIAEGDLELSVQAFVPIARLHCAASISLQSYYPLYDSKPVKLKVKHLPKQGELPGFTGLVGAFKIGSTSLSSNEVHAGSPVYLTVSVIGQGNLSRLVPPKLDSLPGWQSFPVVPDPNPPQLIQIYGTNTFGYAIAPMDERIQATPKIPFCYFDPERMIYVDMSIPSLPLRVLKPIGGGSSSTNSPAIAVEAEPSAARTEAEPALTGIVLRTGRSIQNMSPVHHRGWFQFLQLLPGMLIGGLWIWDRRRRYLAAHPDIVRKRRARWGLRRQRSRMRRAAARGDAAGFIRASVAALQEACAPHIPANPHALVCCDVLNELAPEIRDGPAGAMIRELFQTADAVHFVEKTPTDMALLAFHPQLESLLEDLRRRL